MGEKGRVKGEAIISPRGFDTVGWALLASVVIVTYLSADPGSFWEPLAKWFNIDDKSDLLGEVWFYSWITAVTTGLGVLPFLLFAFPSEFWMGISNSVAGGMMLAASCSLAYEGSTVDETTTRGFFGYPPTFRAVAGFLLGVVFILQTKDILDRFGGEDTLIDNMSSGIANTKKMALIIFVMTLHSMSEGIGIGVSFGGESGKYISLSLAIHNVPEGLAVAIVLCSRRVSKLRASLWAIFTSLPQPIMAIPAFIFVESFRQLLPAGLGFASGAMAYVAIYELLPEAIEKTSLLVTSVVGLLSFGAMLVAQRTIEGADELF